jgi:hypothetical protein
MARALEVSRYQLFYEGEKLPADPALPLLRSEESADDWGSGRAFSFPSEISSIAREDLGARSRTAAVAAQKMTMR